MTNPARRCRRLLVTPEAFDRLKPSDLTPELVDRSAIAAHLPAGTVHQGVALLAEPLPERTIAEVCTPACGVVVVLDQVTDPRNVGAILRSAAAFGACALVVQRRHAPEEGGALAKAASGGLEVVPLIRATNLARAIDILKEIGYWCVGLDARAGQTLAALRLKQPVTLVMGAEGKGLRRLTAEGCDQLVRLPIGSSVESLNVSNAAAIALYELSRQNSN